MLANRFTFGVANVQPCILAQKLYVTKLLLFGQIFATLLAKPMLIWTCSTIQILLCLISKISSMLAASLCNASLSFQGTSLLEQATWNTHVSELFEVESVIQRRGRIIPTRREQYIT